MPSGAEDPKTAALLLFPLAGNIAAPMFAGTSLTTTTAAA
jgi:hypothetical protein